MLLGDVKLVDADKMQYTALHPGQQVHYYTTILQHIYCNDADIGVPSVSYDQFGLQDPGLHCCFASYHPHTVCTFIMHIHPGSSPLYTPPSTIAFSE